MSTKKYVSLDKLSVFLNNLKNTFALKSHKHPVDSDLSDTSENPVQNKVVNAEFDAIAEGMGALELIIDELNDGKQDVLTGTEGQVAQFDASGKLIATDLILITVEHIDAVCGANIKSANDVTF